MKKFIGVDLHKENITVCVVNKDRQVLESRRFYCAEAQRIRDWFAGQGVFEAVVEATASYEWFVQLIDPQAERVVLAHPGKLRIIAQSTRKSDKLDARTLVEFLALDMIPQAYRPTPRQRQHRRLVRHRPAALGWAHAACPVEGDRATCSALGPPSVEKRFPKQRGLAGAEPLRRRESERALPALVPACRLTLTILSATLRSDSNSEQAPPDVNGRDPSGVGGSPRVQS